jgi:hypothetical protein
MNRKKDGRYMIDETNILPDLLEQNTTIYVDRNTKELYTLNIYDTYFLGPSVVRNLVKLENTKATRLLFNQNRQKLPKENK